MNFLKKIQEQIGFVLLGRTIKKTVRERAVHNFNTAKLVGVVFNATEQKNYEKIRKFLSFLSDKKIRVIALGFIDNKNALNFYSYQTGVNFFSHKDLNWFRQPKCEAVNSFIDLNFDILIDFTILKWFPIQYITGLSKAKFKVGSLIENNSNYDLMIDISKNESLDYLLQQVTHYLSVINEPSEIK